MKRRTRTRRWWALVLTLVVFTAAAVALAMKRGEGPGRVTHAAFRTPEVAYQEALQMARNGRFRESLEHFEYAAPTLGRHDWDFENEYSSALYNSTLEIEGVDGMPVPAVPGSLQRVRLVRRSFEEMERAEQLAATAAQRTYLHRTRANMYGVWGFPWEALSELHAARIDAGSDEAASRRYLDSTRAELDMAHAIYLQRMRQPVQPAP
jgi:hypothetical protein